MQDSTATATTATTSTTHGTSQSPAPSPAPAATFRDLLAEDGTQFISGWTQRLPEPYRQHEKSLAKFTGPLELAAGYANLQKHLGERRDTKPPGPDAKSEDITAWRQLLGVPTNPEGYGLRAPENLPEGVAWNEALAQEFAGLAHRLHLPPAAVRELVDFHNAHVSRMHEGALTQHRAEHDQARAELQKEWGGRMAQNSALAARTAALLGLDPNDDSVGNNPKVIRALHRAGELLSAASAEDARLVDGGQANWQHGEGEIQKIRASDDYQGRNGPERQQAAAARMRRIYDVARV